MLQGFKQKVAHTSLVVTAFILPNFFLQAEHAPQVPLLFHTEWPTLNSAIPKQLYIERKVAEIVSQMTLGEKVGQMIMPEFKQITPAEARQYKIGSVLNGGGSWPNSQKETTAEGWAKYSDNYWLALEEAYAGRGFRVPFMWATDAVHGHNNVYGATIFPHNIGLGAARNPDLIHQIGVATAKEVAATGLDLTFAPTVAVPRDYRWGRVYEGYGEIPELIHSYAGRMVEGLQGGEHGLQSEEHVIATVKHWLGDGGTYLGVDRGVNLSSENLLRNIHAAGYYSAIEAGAQVVMTSFNSWKSPIALEDSMKVKFGKLHGSHYLISEILKNKLGFDGIVVTDWNGHGEVNGCTNQSCPQAVIAGNDLFMVTDNNDWKAFYHNVITQVEAGIIPMSRIDDAVTRILRVKMRAGLWNKPKPSFRKLAGQQSILGAEDHKLLAKQAVSESLVLLKNTKSLLPLNRSNQSFLVVGSAANDLSKQTGGWTLTWQGTDNTRSDYLNATSVLEAFIAEVGGKRVFTDIDTAPIDAVAIVAIGEDPYAEMYGDIKPQQTLAYSELKNNYRNDLKLIKSLKKKGYKVVTLFFSGRPLYVNPELDLSDAFVAAWLPGTQATGITDVLFNIDGKDFTGRLPFSWPNKKCDASINAHVEHIPNYTPPEFENNIDKHTPLFPVGFGLNYQSPAMSLDLTMDDREWGCGETKGKNLPEHSLEIYSRNSTDQFVPKMSGQISDWREVFLSREKQISLHSATSSPVNYLHQQDALSINLGKDMPMQFFLQTPDKQGVDMRHYLKANSTLDFDIAVDSLIPSTLKLGSHCVYPCGVQADLGAVLSQIEDLDEDKPWSTIKVPLRCLADSGLEFSNLNTPLLIYSDDPFSFRIGEVRYAPGALSEESDNKRNIIMSCDAFQSIKL